MEQLEPGTWIRTTCCVPSEEGTIPIGTEGKVLDENGENAYYCEFTDVEIETGIGIKIKTVTTTTTVLRNCLYKIPSPA